MSELINDRGFDYEKIASSLTKAKGICHFTGRRPTYGDLLKMVEQADNTLSSTFGRYDSDDIAQVVRKMLLENDSASRICANPQNLYK
jgi:predicted flavoprotein YhiN